MKNIIFIFLFLLSLQSWTKADEISDFEIEGMSIGDSLLDYETKDEIIKFTDSPYKSNKIVYFYTAIDHESTYEGYVAHYKKDDPKFRIVSVEGVIVFKNNISECYALKKTIVTQLDELFKNTEKFSWEKKHNADKSGKSTNVNTQYNFPSKGHIRVSCHDWSDDMEYTDKLSVAISSQEFHDFIENEAY